MRGVTSSGREGPAALKIVLDTSEISNNVQGSTIKGSYFVNISVTFPSNYFHPFGTRVIATFPLRQLQIFMNPCRKNRCVHGPTNGLPASSRRNERWATLAEECDLLLVGFLCFVTSFAKITTMTRLVVTVGFDAFVWFATRLLAKEFCLFFGPLLLRYTSGHGFRGDSRRPSRWLGCFCSHVAGAGT